VPDASWRSTAYRLVTARSALLECAIGVAVLAASVAAVLSNAASPTGSAIMCGLGFASVGGGSLLQQRP
jgi:hypothetical protein